MDQKQSCNDQIDSFSNPRKDPNQVNPERPEYQAMGLLDSVNCEGWWTLDWEGTLHFSGHDMLHMSYGADSHRGKVKRIVIDGFENLGPCIFESFRECEEVMINVSYVFIGNRTFAHCQKLKSVIFKGVHYEEPDSFRDTPYQAALEGVEYVPEERKEDYLASSDWGRKLIGSISEEIEKMKTQKSTKNIGHSGFLYDHMDDNDWFFPALEMMRKGAGDSDPAMLYLTAELGSYGFVDFLHYYDDWGSIPLNLNSDSSEPFVFYKNADIVEIYLSSAEKGFPYAMLWCAFCLSMGKYGFPEDHERSAQYLRTLIKSDRVPRTLNLSELRFMKYEVDNIVEQAHDADIMEDIARGDPILDPDPSWRTLHLRTIDLVCFMVSLGLTYELNERGYDYQWPSEFRAIARRLLETKKEWLDWCIEQGLEITMM